MSSINAEDIVESEVWKELIAELNHDIWQEFKWVPLGDVEAQTRVRYCQWALERIVLALETRMRGQPSPNLSVLK